MNLNAESANKLPSLLFEKCMIGGTSGPLKAMELFHLLISKFK
ncbi:hypothetical protein B4098_0731 [Heyndrickxia coagulans]|uniref:Uncharacterized protein n=1 Tax=Heyndrickxia coagulans TaxID=1398 RepID=A0A150KDZ8_HEYCO|nr:hypothetical protein BCO26_0488 [Heyndrickxia coagulans 2-6]KYC63387.1 hypothetical protein B4098_0731 [Heyndrickxia coagulans]KYC67836.1 hypothetical protein B4099_0851 [Heyndrickxia coagulans]